MPAVQKLRDSRARSPAGAPLCGVATRENRTDTYTVVCTRVNIQSDTPAHPRVGKYQNKRQGQTMQEHPATYRRRSKRAARVTRARARLASLKSSLQCLSVTLASLRWAMLDRGGTDRPCVPPLSLLPKPLPPGALPKLKVLPPTEAATPCCAAIRRAEPRVSRS